MKKLFSLVLMNFVLGLSIAQATSLHPCTPVVQAKPLRMSCSENGVFYGIRIETIMSDVRRCPVDQMIEVHTAHMRVTDKMGNVLQTLTLPHEEFTFDLGTLGDARFQSKSHSLDFNNCAVPMHGGFSIGN